MKEEQVGMAWREPYRVEGTIPRGRKSGTMRLPHHDWREGEAVPRELAEALRIPGRRSGVRTGGGGTGGVGTGNHHYGECPDYRVD